MKYKDLYDLIKDAPACQVPTPSVDQYPDGTWFWLDETGNPGDDVRYETRESAQAAQSVYCDWLMGDPNV